MEAAMDQLNQATAWVMRASVATAALVLLVLLVQWVFGKYLPARWRYALWLLVLVRLALPVVPSSPLSVWNLSRNWHEALMPSESSTIVSRSAAVAAADGVAEAGPRPTPANRGVSEARTALAALWLLTVGLLASRMALGNYRLSSRVSRQRPVVNESVLNLLEDCKQLLKVHVPIDVVQSAKISSPALLGFLRPRLLLPNSMIESFEQEELRHVFLHELAHLKRGDVAVNWIMSALQVVHWFNPVLWFAFRRMRTEREMACDAHVLAAVETEERRSYGRTILRTITFLSGGRLLPGAVGIVEDKSEITRRIDMIATFRGSSSKQSVLGGVLLLCLAVVGLTGAEHATAKPAVGKDGQMVQGVYPISKQLGSQLQGDRANGYFHYLVPWPRGSTVAYSPASQKLVVKNTSQNLAILEWVLNQVDPGSIDKAPTATPQVGTMLYRSYSVNKSLAAELGTQKTIRGSKDYLQRMGIEFPVGSTSQFVPHVGTLIFVNTAENIKALERLLKDLNH